VTDVLGYVSQCELCGQRAITLAPHDSDWVCPRCAEVTDRSPYSSVASGQDCGIGINLEATAAMFPQHRGHTTEFLDGAGNLSMTDDDGPDLRKVQI
jgi:predicted RNA-binding Zn-ribbon protein involved in translation (DUF1610 family)